MRTFFSPVQLAQRSAGEIIGGRLVPSFETPERATLILAEIEARGLGQVAAPEEGVDDARLRAVHAGELVDFLREAWTLWEAEHGAVDAIPNTWPAPGATGAEPRRINARLGRYAVDMSSAVTPGTFEAAMASLASAGAAGAHVAGGARAAFALCRPPGHHAGRDWFGGYCFLNNAAYAAEGLRASGASRVAVLDIDYHHGNGTQDIFYGRADVLTVSIHADPADEYPYYLGYADETGAGAGEGFNLNLPLPIGTAMERYGEALEEALARIAAFGAEALVVSLGVDTFEADPISRFRLASHDFSRIGRRLASASLPTVFVMEGGYATADLGRNTVNVLSAFDEAAGLSP